MVMFSSEWAREVLDEVFIDLYKRVPERFDNDVRIFEDLHSDKPERGFARKWISRAAKRLGVNENNLNIKERDYTLGEIIDKLRRSKREKYDGRIFHSVSGDIEFDNLDNLQTN